MIFYYCKLHKLKKASYFKFSFYSLLFFTFSVFSTLQKNKKKIKKRKIKLFYKYTRKFSELFKSFNVWFHHILLEYYFLKQLWLIFESVKALAVKSSMLFELNFANSTILPCFSLLFLQVFDPIADFVIPTEISSKETKAKIVHPVAAEAKIKTCSIQFKVVEIFLNC